MMFQESPFSGACTYAVWEVILMLVGTLLLGLLLGYLIWGWTRRKLMEAETKIASLITANTRLEQQLEELTTTNTAKQEELDAINTVNNSQRQQLASLTVTNSNLKKQLDQVADSSQEHKSELENLQSAMAANETQRSDLQKQLSDAQLRNSDLERLLKKLRKDKAKKLRKNKARPVESMHMDTGDSGSDNATGSVGSNVYADPFSSEGEDDKSQTPEPQLLTRASKIFGKEIVHNDLVLIEGIGPGIAVVLENSGITSWEILSDTTHHILRVILDDAGPLFHGHKPKTWPRQARMAANGEWKKLKAYQDVLLGGK